MDALQKIGDAPLVDCPECGLPTLKKLISAAGFRLKGSGWYETDFKSGDKRNLHDGGEKKTGEKSETAPSKDKKEKPAADKKPASKPATAGTD